MWCSKLSVILMLQIAILVNSWPEYEIQKSVELYSSDESNSRYPSSEESNENWGNSERFVNCEYNKPGRRVGQQPHFIPPGQNKKGHGEHYLPPRYTHRNHQYFYPTYTPNALNFPERGPFSGPEQNHQHNHYHRHNPSFPFGGPTSNYPFYPHIHYSQHPHFPSFPPTQYPLKPLFTHQPSKPQYPLPSRPGNIENHIPGGNKGSNKCRGNMRQNCREQPRPQVPVQPCRPGNRQCQTTVQTPQPVIPIQTPRPEVPVPMTPLPIIPTTSSTPSTTTPSDDYPDIDIRFGDGDSTASSSLKV